LVCTCLFARSLVGILMDFYCHFKNIRLQSFVDEGEREMMHE
jgi:hypothetical protein